MQQSPKRLVTLQRPCQISSHAPAKRGPDWRWASRTVQLHLLWLHRGRGQRGGDPEVCGESLC